MASDFYQLTMHAAIIGCGAIAEEHMKALARLEGMDVLAYCDVAMDRASSFLRKYGGDYATDDVERIFSDHRIDVVYICTLHDTHAPLAIRACEAGKHVMLEKPMALTVEECEAIGEAVERTGVTLMTAFKLRYYPAVQRAREFITRPIVTIVQVMDSRWPDDFWGQDPVKGGGNVLSQGCHAIDLICWLNRSEPVTIYAEGGTYTHEGSPVIDTMVSTIRFASGSLASVAQGDSGQTPYVSKWSFQLVDGIRSVHLHDRLKRATFFDGEKSWTMSDEEELGMVEENRAFIHALQTGAPPPTTWRDGLRATLLLLKAFRAVRTGEVQRVEI
jgi:predicted dehydrogenase